MTEPDNDYLEKWRALMEKRGQTLTLGERKIIAMRLGLEDGQFHTLEEAAQRFKVTRERIRALEVRALHKLSMNNPGMRRRSREE